MKKILTGILLLAGLKLSAQSSSINIVAMHQLINNSQSEYKEQTTVKNKQAAVDATEVVNRSQMTKLKDKYREIQSRFSIVGTIIGDAQIAMQAIPLSESIVKRQGQLVALAQQYPLMIPFALGTEIAFAKKAEGTIRYMIGLSLSIGVVNQMKASNRKLLFDYGIDLLQEMDEELRVAVNTIIFSGSLNSSDIPFSNYVNQDKDLTKSILTRFKTIKQ
ncbi:hypothetical protein [Mucilaginibacter lappiensis]|uniref:Uncharacterized protein n=1 Tax=Mucilaginibacter lappiensis TaxID=354630 RepID=A0A841JK00_9SPHI|nr:hypothetical protein [Mucilaginibacter lappiensis]MBB6131513.1 hypothetical protein [Mucilaginibacter lappiensis]